MDKNVALIHLEEGTEAVISAIVGGREATKRLSDLGLTPETRLKILRKAPFWGPLEIEVRGSRLVIGRGIASKVMVKPV